MTVEHITDTEWEWLDDDDGNDDEGYQGYEDDDEGYEGQGDDEDEDYWDWNHYPDFPPEPWTMQLYWRVKHALTHLVSSIKWSFRHA